LNRRRVSGLLTSLSNKTTFSFEAAEVLKFEMIQDVK